MRAAISALETEFGAQLRVKFLNWIEKEQMLGICSFFAYS